MNDLLGQKFGKLRVLLKQSADKHGNICWLCECECGNRKIISSYYLRSGHVKSCGCIARSHGLSGSFTYQKWIDMLQRCRNKNRKDYKNHGARGITICDRWFTFKNFYADMGECPKGLTIERIDNDGNYEPSNCKWATHKEQRNNTRNNRIIEYKGQKLTLAQWADKLRINYSTLKYRLRRSWSIERALAEPINSC